MKRALILAVVMMCAACGMTPEEQQAHWLKNHKEIIAKADAALAQGRVSDAKSLIARLPAAHGPKMTALRGKIEAAESAAEAKAAEAKRHDDIFWAAVAACRNMVKVTAKYPSKVDFEWSVKGNYAGRVLAGRADMMNGFGAMIPHRYACTFDAQGYITDFDVREG